MQVVVIIIIRPIFRTLHSNRLRGEVNKLKSREENTALAPVDI